MKGYDEAKKPNKSNSSRFAKFRNLAIDLAIDEQYSLAIEKFRKTNLATDELLFLIFILN